MYRATKSRRESVVAQSDWGGVAKSNGSLCLVHDRKRRWGLGSAPHEQSRKSKLSCDCSGRLFPPRRLKRRATRARASLALLAYWPPRTQYWPLSLAQPSPALSLLPACSWAATCMLPPLLVRCALSASWDDDDNNREHLWIFCPTPVSRSIRQMQLPY